VGHGSIQRYLEVNPKDARRIVDRCLSANAYPGCARQAARTAPELTRKELPGDTTLPGKLADCSDKVPHTELYIVEGDSAGGCFSGDTQIALADGRSISFAEFVEEQAQGKAHFLLHNPQGWHDWR